MISVQDIQATALLVFKQHGRSSSYYTLGRAETLRDEGAHTGAETREKIAALVEMWERETPGPDEAVNYSEITDRTGLAEERFVTIAC